MADTSVGYLSAVPTLVSARAIHDGGSVAALMHSLVAGWYGHWCTCSVRSRRCRIHDRADSRPCLLLRWRRIGVAALLGLHAFHWTGCARTRPGDSSHRRIARLRVFDPMRARQRRLRAHQSGVPSTHLFIPWRLAPFPPLYLLHGGVRASNRFELAADRFAATGRGWWPWA